MAYSTMSHNHIKDYHKDDFSKKVIIKVAETISKSYMQYRNMSIS